MQTSNRLLERDHLSAKDRFLLLYDVSAGVFRVMEMCPLPPHASPLERESPNLLAVAPPPPKKKTGQASSSLSRFRDSLPPRHGRPARQRASGIMAV